MTCLIYNLENKLKACTESCTRNLTESGDLIYQNVSGRKIRE